MSAIIGSMSSQTEVARTKDQLELYDALLDLSAQERERFLNVYENMYPINVVAVREMFQERTTLIQTSEALPSVADIFHQAVFSKKGILKEVSQPIIEIEEQEEIHRLANQKYENFIAKYIAVDQYKEFGSEHLSVSEQFLVQQCLNEEAQIKAVNKYKKLDKDHPNLSTAERALIRQWIGNKSNQSICLKKASIEEVNERETLLRQEEGSTEKTTKIRFADRDEKLMFSINAPPTIGFIMSIPAISRSRDSDAENPPSSRKCLQSFF